MSEAGVGGEDSGDKGMISWSEGKRNRNLVTQLLA